MKRTFLIASALALSALTAACDTVAGAGQDISHGGQGITRAADDNK